MKMFAVLMLCAMLVAYSNAFFLTHPHLEKAEDLAEKRDVMTEKRDVMEEKRHLNVEKRGQKCCKKGSCKPC